MEIQDEMHAIDAFEDMIIGMPSRNPENQRLFTNTQYAQIVKITEYTIVCGFVWGAKLLFRGMLGSQPIETGGVAFYVAMTIGICSFAGAEWLIGVVARQLQSMR